MGILSPSGPFLLLLSWVVGEKERRKCNGGVTASVLPFWHHFLCYFKCVICLNVNMSLGDTLIPLPVAYEVTSVWHWWYHWSISTPASIFFLIQFLKIQLFSQWTKDFHKEFPLSSSWYGYNSSFRMSAIVVWQRSKILPVLLPLQLKNSCQVSVVEEKKWEDVGFFFLIVD